MDKWDGMGMGGVSPSYGDDNETGKRIAIINPPLLRQLPGLPSATGSSILSLGGT